MLRSRLRVLFTLFAVAATLSFVASEADARAGRGFSGGSRGARTYSAPPPTATAPNTASPLQRSATQPAAPRAPAATAPATAGRQGGLFGGGLLGGLAAGFIGAGLLGLLLGHGFLGGLAGFASFLGLLLQIVIVIIVARLAWAWWQRRSQPAFAGPNMRDAASGSAPRPSGLGLSGLGGLGSFASGGPLKLEAEDFDAFERLLGEIQTAYGAEDLAALRSHVTPEMFSYFSEELAQNASQGVTNRISGVKLLQGDLAEAWREGTAEYATVAMRFALVDEVVDRDTGRLVEGGTQPVEVTELWTFRRAPGSPWLLSAIQQA